MNFNDILEVLKCFGIESTMDGNKVYFKSGNDTFGDYYKNNDGYDVRILTSGRIIRFFPRSSNFVLRFSILNTKYPLLFLEHLNYTVGNRTYFIKIDTTIDWNLAVSFKLKEKNNNQIVIVDRFGIYAEENDNIVGSYRVNNGISNIDYEEMNRLLNNNEYIPLFLEHYSKYEPALMETYNNYMMDSVSHIR